MRKLVLGLVAASVIAAPAAAAPNGHFNNRDRHEQVQRSAKSVKTVKVTRARQAVKHNGRKGQRFDSRYARSYAVIHDPRAYGLNTAPRGYRWVQSDNNLILVSIASGIIGAVIASAR